MALAGFTNWKPTGESERILNAVMQVFDDYRDYLPLTGRQVFYRLVGAYGFPKDERAANKLYNVLGRARRAGILPFNWLRDGGGQVQRPLTYDDEPAFWTKVDSDFQHYRRARQAGQPIYIELFCEAPGMMPQLVRAAFPYSVPVYGTRGYTGLSVVGEVARRALNRDVRTVILQVGDLDPSGVGIFETLAADVKRFVAQSVAVLSEAHKYDEERANGCHALVQNLGVSEDRTKQLVENAAALRTMPSIRAERIALTWDQVDEYDLPTAPPSSKDSRSKNWPYDDTAQAEALPPDILQQIVRTAIEDHLDMDIYQEEVDREEADIETIGDKLAEVGT